jgi:ribosomal protein S18 acetylase RimI-like enzyme
VITVRALDHDRDAEACDAIIASLPGWFGNDDGIRECRELVRSAPGLVSEDAQRVVGFLTYARRYATTAEVTWIAVHADHRNAGIGSALLDELARGLASDGIRLLLVKTLSDREDPGQEYAATRAFYLARGFIPAIELDIWGPENPAQLLARPL